MGLQNDKEFHTKGLAASEIDLHALLSEYEKSKPITKWWYLSNKLTMCWLTINYNAVVMQTD